MADGRDARTQQARRGMLRAIDREVAETARHTGRAELSPVVRGAMGRVPRDAFVPEREREQAHANRPLPIGHGQTISQPYIVAISTELLDPRPDSRVLEVGTGCGYQAAVLAELAGEVHTVEAVRELAGAARDRLRRLGYTNVTVHEAGETVGLPALAPFDAVLATAAASRAQVRTLTDQLAPGGRMVIPVDTGGGFPGGQSLVRITKDAHGEVTERELLPVAFVPMV